MFLFQPGSPGSPVRVLVFRPVVQVRVEREAVSLPLMIRAEERSEEREANAVNSGQSQRWRSNQ